MNRFLKSFAITAAVALFTIASAGTASAGDRGHGKSYGGHYGSKHYGGKHYYGFSGIVGSLLYGGYSHGYRSGHSYRYKYNYRRGHNAYRRHSHRRHGHGSYQRMGYTQNSPGYVAQRPCHSTYKHGYAHGRQAKIGGTMCYDNYGNSYIVAGSRHVIGYY